MPTPFYQTKKWHQARVRVLRRDGYRCTNCRALVQGKKQARVDHIVPLKERPDLSLDLDNLRTLCTRCDAARHREKGGGRPASPVGDDGLPLVGPWRDG